MPRLASTRRTSRVPANPSISTFFRTGKQRVPSQPSIASDNAKQTTKNTTLAQQCTGVRLLLPSTKALNGPCAPQTSSKEPLHDTRVTSNTRSSPRKHIHTSNPRAAAAAPSASTQQCSESMSPIQRGMCDQTKITASGGLHSPPSPTYTPNHIPTSPLESPTRSKITSNAPQTPTPDLSPAGGHHRTIQQEFTMSETAFKHKSPSVDAVKTTSSNSSSTSGKRRRHIGCEIDSGSDTDLNVEEMSPAPLLVRSGTRRLRTPRSSTALNTIGSSQKPHFRNELVDTPSSSTKRIHHESNLLDSPDTQQVEGGTSTLKTKISFNDRLKQAAMLHAASTTGGGGGAPIHQEKLRFPEKFTKLERVFNGLENALFFNTSNGSHSIACSANVFHKVKRAVETFSGLDFNLNRMGQIREIYPEAYTYKPASTLDNGRRVASFSIVINDADKKNDDKQSVKSDSSLANKLIGGSSVVHGGYMAPAIEEMNLTETHKNALAVADTLRKRKREFHHRLAKRVKTSHTTFVEKKIGDCFPHALGNPSQKSTVEEIRKVYIESNEDDDNNNLAFPGFDPDRDVADVEPKSMNDVLPVYQQPLLATKSATENVTAQLITVNSGDSKIAALRAKLAEKKNIRLELEKNSSVPRSPTDSQPSTPPPPQPMSKAAQILADIRKRDKERKELLEKGGILTAEQLKLKGMLERIPHILQSILAFYISQRRGVMPLSKVAQQVMQGLNSSGTGNFITIDKVVDHIRLVAEASPLWCQLTSLKMGTVMKINRDYPLLKVKADIEGFAKRHNLIVALK